MKKLLGLLSAVCAMALCLCAAYASPLTGDTSNMGLWIAMVVVAVIAMVVLLRTSSLHQLVLLRL